jgi:predicted GIY-YIG superfamily endonuclease
VVLVLNPAVPAAQQLLFPDPQPLVELLGRDFFRTLPQRPGVYLMRDAGEIVLYVGKAKNLRKRLGSYRVANPDRMPRRHLRLLRAVRTIELHECVDERDALSREAELLRTLKPRFNRAGTWPGTPRFVAWRTTEDAVEFTITPAPEDGWCACGPFGGGASRVCALLARLLWIALNPKKGIEQLPAGWSVSDCVAPILVRRNDAVAGRLNEVDLKLQALIGGEMDGFCEWIGEHRSPDAHPFERAWLEAELESLREWL